MNPQDPLAALHPLREPAAVGLWPPAPGWWLLCALLVAAVVATCAWLYRRHRASAYRRTALAQLERLHHQFRTDGNAVAYAEGANALLKSAALVAYPARDVAALHGSAWLAFLENSATGTAFAEDFTQAVYSGDAQRLDVEQLHTSARRWLNRHRSNP